MKLATISISIPLAVLFCTTCLFAAKEMGSAKTLVAWVIPANLSQQGGSVLTIQSGPQFDGIVFGERLAGRWMAGSDNFRRTQASQEGNASESAGAETMVQVAIVYDGEGVRIFRNGRPYAAYPTKNIDLLGDDKSMAVFGLRHVGSGSGAPLAGAIEDARIYARALTADPLAPGLWFQKEQS